ncbi:transposase [Micromonospora cremea]|uniref:transposase n=1 Tax=Micromonospora cremea TaxID=709881 RepID=UPI000940EC63|nr:transposase [Micromonospora cremea]
MREWDTRGGTIDLALPKLRQGSNFPDCLLTHRRQALVPVERGLVSARGVNQAGEKTDRASRHSADAESQVSEMAAHLDAQVEAFRNRLLDSGHYTARMDLLTMKVREAAAPSTSTP